MAAPDRPNQFALITNYAARGLALQALDPPQKGDQVSITIAFLGTYHGIVRWSAARSFGVRMHGLIDVLELSIAKPGPHFRDYRLPRSDVLEGLYLHIAFRQGLAGGDVL